MLDNEKGKRILVLRRAEKRKSINHLQEVLCHTPIRQFLGFPKGHNRRFDHEKVGNSLINLGGMAHANKAQEEIGKTQIRRTRQ
ncbi:unnamed protein product [Sphenostylis stenocarpa]|uniref:Uncharacterized protein n=1 Tax=Sphenostylis stenocarpa TaxID=92480 RepID=A0AA86W587_9FABA|nr:unnamed protein product [Sphenostylis stenocarpa]